MTVHYADDQITLHHGKDLDVLRTLPDRSVNCVVTSPPYFGLRDYGVDGQRGLEASPAEYVAGLVEVFAEVRRVLADDGTCWLNLGDSYSGSGRGPAGNLGKRHNERHLEHVKPDWDVSPKNLLGIPWRVAFALQDDDWTLRNAIVWAKPNAMPESVTDRLSTRYELVFLLTKARRYWFDLDAIREPHSPNTASFIRMKGQWAEDRTQDARMAREMQGVNKNPNGGLGPGQTLNPAGRNPGDVWTIPTVPYPGAHYAVMAPRVAEQCVLAGCKPGGVVLDPYSGVGTTGMVALRHGHRYIGIDIDAENHDKALRTRLQQGALIPDAEVTQ